MCVRVLYALFTAASCFFLSKHRSRVIVFLFPRSQYVPHLTPHVPLLASGRSLISWSSNCNALLEIIHIIRCKSFVCVINSDGAVCIFSRTDRPWAYVYLEYTQNVLKVLLLSTPKKHFLRG